MAKLPRVTLRLFGGSGASTFFGQFGSKKAGVPQTSLDPSILQQLAAWVDGWQEAISSSDKAPYLQDMNSFGYVHSYMTSYIFQMGLAEWDPGTTYYKNSVVQDNTGLGQWFVSIQDTNSNNPPSAGASNAWWTWVNAPQVAAGTMIDFAGRIAPFGYLVADGSTVLRATYGSLLSAITTQTFGTLVLGQPQITAIPSTANLRVGDFISGTGIPSAAKILTVDSGTQVTMTLNASSSQTGGALVFAPWGVGDGVTTFTLPDTRRRTAVGQGGTGTSVLGNSVGSTGGEETHTLTVPEIPSHNHTTTALKFGASGLQGGAGSGLVGGDIGFTGGGGAHNNMQPSYVVEKCIKF